MNDPVVLLNGKHYEGLVSLSPQHGASSGGLQMLRVAANVLNSSGQPKMGGPLAWVLAWGQQPFTFET
jgi:hypothetical protein